MLVLVHDRLPTGIGESLSGSRAFIVNSLLVDDWHSVEAHPDFQSLTPDEQEEVRKNFPRCVEYHRVLRTVKFY